MIFKNCAPFTDCISKINNIQLDKTKHIDAVKSMYDSIECSDIYLKTCGSLWQYYKNESALDNAGTIIDFLLIIIVARLNLEKR